MKTSVVAAALVMTAMAGPCQAFSVASPAVGSTGKIPSKYAANLLGCSGDNVSLPLAWKDVPAGAQSLALTMFDPDAPFGFWHWLVVDLPPATRRLPAGAGDPGDSALPQGAVQARDDAGVSGYFGPCPPRGDPPHRYVITVYAVKTARLSVDAGASGAEVVSRLQPETIAKASVTYLYGR